MNAIRCNIYDHPRYYDLVFGADCRTEFNFLLTCFQWHGLRNVRRLFEPACGTGRLLLRLARAGFDVVGLDLNERAVRYCNDRFARHGLSRRAFVGDMASFQLSRPVDAAFNLINSFRHLTNGRAAASHLRCVSRALREGGLYVIGLHLTPTVGKPTDTESWRATRGPLSVATYMRTTERDLRRRTERFVMSYAVQTPRRRLRLADEILFRTYTAMQFMRLVRKVADLEICGIYDFRYNVHEPIELSPQTESAVFVLRKRTHLGGPSRQPTAKRRV